MRQVTDSREFGRVALVMGGDGAEREVSLRGGQAIHAALLRRDIDAVAVDGIPALLARIQAGQVDRVFNLIHGRGGEDGVLQGLLKALRVPVTGSGVLGSALSMDKVRSKQVWQAIGLPTAPYCLLDSEDPLAQLHELGLPLVIKPVHEGSSVGVTRVFQASELPMAMAASQRPDDQLMAERLIDGPEYTAAILGDQVLPLIRIEPLQGFYDYHAKYTPGSTRYSVPCGLDEDSEQRLRKLSLQAFAALGCSGWGRVDLMLDAQARPWLIELNTTPGMTETSLLPKAAAAMGIDFDTLVWRILETSMDGGGV